MTTKSSHPSPPDARPHIANVVYRSLSTAVTEQCHRRHDADVVVNRLNQPEAETPMRIRIACPAEGQITARIIIRHAGGNVHDVHTEVGEEQSPRFSYSRSRRSGTALSRAPCLGRRLGSFLVDKLEQQLGREVLSSEEHPSSA